MAGWNCPFIFRMPPTAWCGRWMPRTCENCQVQALVMNTFHLMQKPGSTTIQALGGLHKMSGWHAGRS